MYVFFRAILDFFWHVIRGEIVAGKRGSDAMGDKDKLRRAGGRIRDYIRLRGRKPDEL